MTPNLIALNFIKERHKQGQCQAYTVMWPQSNNSN